MHSMTVHPDSITFLGNERIIRTMSISIILE